MSRVAVYDQNAVDLVLVGIPIDDMRADEFVSIEFVDDDWAEVVGADGGVTRYRVGNPVAKVSVTLKAASKHNQQLSAIRILDLTSTNGAGIGVFLLKDNNGATLIAADTCWITKPPTVTKGKEPGDWVWSLTIVPEAASVVIGGN